MLIGSSSVDVLRMLLLCHSHINFLKVLFLSVVGIILDSAYLTSLVEYILHCITKMMRNIPKV